MSVNDISKIKAANLFSVDGLMAVVTGGGSGLGAYMARALAANGAKKVFIIGRREDALNRTRDSLAEIKDIIIPIVGDVTSKSSLQECVEKVKSHGVTELDVLFCNSGIGGPKASHKDSKTNQPFENAEQLAESLWAPEPQDVTNTYHVNVTGIQFTVAAFLPLLAAANKARPEPTRENFKPRPQIITVSSIGAYNRVPMTNFSYGPSKAAVVHLTKQLSTVLVPYDIRVNTIAPGLYWSEMTEGGISAAGLSDKHDIEGSWPKEQIPSTRSGSEEDMAGVVLWLCSRAGGYVNGQIVVTDGGRLSVLPSAY